MNNKRCPSLEEEVLEETSMVEVFRDIENISFGKLIVYCDIIGVFPNNHISMSAGLAYGFNNGERVFCIIHGSGDFSYRQIIPGSVSFRLKDEVYVVRTKTGKVIDHRTVEINDFEHLCDYVKGTYGD